MRKDDTVLFPHIFFVSPKQHTGWPKKVSHHQFFKKSY